MNKLQNSKYKLTILWLYPDLMNTYGDRGNIIALRKRCKWRGIGVEIVEHSVGDSIEQIKIADLIFMGGAQDRQQELVAKDFVGQKSNVLKQKIDRGVPGLYICGAYQFLGKYYKTAEGKKIPGLTIFDLHTVHSGDQDKRLIGNIVLSWNGHKIVGFENHGGRTYIGSNSISFGSVIVGSGNNGEDGEEGMVYNNSIGTYLHGPILPKNPEVADWLLTKAIEYKYGKPIVLEPLEDKMEHRTRSEMIVKLS